MGYRCGFTQGTRRSGWAIVPLCLAVACCAPASHAPSETVDNAASPAAVDGARIKDVIGKAQSNILGLQIAEHHWDIPSYMGIHYTAQYYLALQWLGDNTKKLDPNVLKQALLSLQLSTGAWRTVRDEFGAVGDINATVINYAALKAMGEAPSGAALTAARNWILANGGLDKINLINKMFFAAFNQLSWDQLMPIPYLEVIPPLFGQWIGPHLFPLSYLRTQHVQRELGPRFNLDELRTGTESKPQAIAQRGAHPGWALRIHVARMLEMQQSKGSFGGYTIATMLALMALDDYSKTWPADTAGQIPADTRTRAETFLHTMYIDNTTKNLDGVVTDGHLWDTAILAHALLDSGIDPKRLTKASDYLSERLCTNGGLPFGNDFEAFPDTDDTAMALMVFAANPENSATIQKSARFLYGKQNRDGGLGAFARNNFPIRILRPLVAPVEDSADIWDESSPDIVGHVLEGLGRALGPQNVAPAFRYFAINYLKKSRSPAIGAWDGRWGVNYIYGTSAVVCGLAAVGINNNDDLVRSGLEFISSCQNADGGFGETSKSYDNAAFAGKGTSTPSQTAWALLALLEDYPRYTAQIDVAAAYLVNAFARDGKWIDTQAVGTGHPKVNYIEYPSYPYGFPLLALSKYLRVINGAPGTPL